MEAISARYILVADNSKHRSADKSKKGKKPADTADGQGFRQPVNSVYVIALKTLLIGYDKPADDRQTCTMTVMAFSTRILVERGYELMAGVSLSDVGMMRRYKEYIPVME